MSGLLFAADPVQLGSPNSEIHLPNEAPEARQLELNYV